jgi:hypothetical protein
MGEETACLSAPTLGWFTIWQIQSSSSLPGRSPSLLHTSSKIGDGGAKTLSPLKKSISRAHLEGCKSLPGSIDRQPASGRKSELPRKTSLLTPGKRQTAAELFPIPSPADRSLVGLLKQSGFDRFTMEEASGRGDWRRGDRCVGCAGRHSSRKLGVREGVNLRTRQTNLRSFYFEIVLK